MEALKIIISILMVASFAHANPTLDAITQLEQGIEVEIKDEMIVRAKASSSYDWRIIYELNEQAKAASRSKRRQDLKNLRTSVGSYLTTLPPQRTNAIDFISCQSLDLRNECIYLRNDISVRVQEAAYLGSELGPYQKILAEMPSLRLDPLFIEVLFEFYAPALRSTDAVVIGLFNRGLDQAAFEYALHEFQRGFGGTLSRPPLEFTEQELAANKFYRQALKHKPVLQKAVGAIQLLELIMLGRKHTCTPFGLNPEANKKMLMKRAGFSHRHMLDLATQSDSCSSTTQSR